MKKNILTIILIFLFSNVITAQTVVHCPEAGQLSNILKELKIDIDTVKHLKLTGIVDARDFKTLRKKMSSPYEIGPNDVMESIDLSGITKIKGHTGLNVLVSYRNWAYAKDELPIFAFVEFYKLSKIILPTFITYLDWGLFASCKELENINIPPNITKIGKNTFYNCTKLKNITLPTTLTHIESSVFEGCTALTSITLPPSITHIESSAFKGSGLTSITLPPNVISIGDFAFENCKNLSGTFYLSKKITSLGKSPFGYNSKTLTIDLDKDNPNYTSDKFGNVFTKDMSTLLFIAPNAEGRYRINPTTKNIQKYAGNGIDGLTGVIFPDSMKYLDTPSLFNDCKNLNYIDFNGIEGMVLSKNAFRSCPIDTMCLLRRPYTYDRVIVTTDGGNIRGVGRSFENPEWIAGIFQGIKKYKITLVVPKDSIEVFLMTAPWYGVKKVVAREGTLTSTPTVLSSAKVEAYPNPTSDVIRIRFDGTLANLKIYTLDGKTVYNQPVRSGESINVREWSSGLYYLRFSFDGKETEGLKLIKR